MDLNDTPELAEYRDTGARVARRAQARGARQPRGRRRVGRGPARVAAARWPRAAWPRSRGRPSTAAPASARSSRSSSTRRSAAPACPGSSTSSASGMLGPTLIAHGSEEQKQRHLGPMLTADEVWCQLFSEPAAGSDLAGVQTRARRQDDGSWRLSGQKVWTTNAQHAAFGLLLARTNPDVPKHKGLTMFIVPMDAEGVTVRPLRQISGEAHFNEVFFDDVRARARLGGRPGRRRLGRRPDDADVRARDDRARRRGLRLARGPLRARAARGRGVHARRRDAPPLRRDRGRLPRAALHRLPHADVAAARPDPGRRGRAREGHHDPRRDRRRRPDLRRARARRGSPTSASASSSPTCRG